MEVSECFYDGFETFRHQAHCAYPKIDFSRFIDDDDSGSPPASDDENGACKEGEQADPGVKGNRTPTSLDTYFSLLFLRVNKRAPNL